jgi:hypothetical protein
VRKCGTIRRSTTSALAPGRLVRPLERDEIEAHFEGARFLAGFAPKSAPSTPIACRALRRAVMRAPGLTFRPLTNGARGERGRGGLPDWWRWAGRRVDPATLDRSSNATWRSGWRSISASGYSPPPGPLAPTQVSGQSPRAGADAAGAFSDHGRALTATSLVRPDRTAYLSWYPAGLRGGVTISSRPPSGTRRARSRASGTLPTAIAASIRSASPPGTRAYGSCEALQVDAGAIVAIGRTDVDDAASGLPRPLPQSASSRAGAITRSIRAS